MRFTKTLVPSKAVSEAKRLEQQYGAADNAPALMSDDDLFNYIVLKTFEYGRSWPESIENARSHFLLGTARTEFGEIGTQGVTG